MDLELHQLELRYEKLRRRDSRKERQLVASLAEKGQLLPVVVVRPRDADGYILVDGYKRSRALRTLKQDLVHATLWDLAELDAVLLERLMHTGDADGALEQGWLLEDLHERFALSHEELARRFDKSQSWVSRRLALVRILPHAVQERVRCGTLPPHAAMKFLVPMARAKRADCERLVAALVHLQPSTRELGELYAAWASGNRETRELVVTQPALVLRAREQARQEKSEERTPLRQLLADFGILIGTSRRARQRLAGGLLARLLTTEEQDARRGAQQARWECDALFRSAATLLDSTSAPSVPETNALAIANPPTASQELSDAR